MSVWQFATNEDADAFWRQIVGEMIARYGVSEGTAVALVNRLWRGNGFEAEDLRYHREVEF
jgi:hypothetical protein